MRGLKNKFRLKILKFCEYDNSIPVNTPKIVKKIYELRGGFYKRLEIKNYVNIFCFCGQDNRRHANKYYGRDFFIVF